MTDPRLGRTEASESKARAMSQIYFKQAMAAGGFTTTDKLLLAIYFEIRHQTRMVEGDADD